MGVSSEKEDETLPPLVMVMSVLLLNVPENTKHQSEWEVEVALSTWGHTEGLSRWIGPKQAR